MWRGRSRASRGVWLTPAIAAVVVLSSCATTVSPPAVSAVPDFEVAAADLEQLIEHEMADKGLPALSIAVMHGGRLVWARGFGLADPDRGRRADARTVYRAGSISKLFTDIAVMQLVEREQLDLDAPVTDYLPDFAPGNAFSEKITLRHLMSHRAGLFREPPVGHYFDPSSPSLEATVASLNETDLVYAPGTRIKYSNAGLAVVGLVVQRVSTVSFDTYVRREIIEPLQLTRTAFEPTLELRSQLAAGYMWTYDGREFAAPDLDLGMAPAANLYSTAVDLARFANAWCVGVQSTDPAILEESSWQEMFRPQFTTREEGIGLGFFVDQFEGHLRVRHNGAMYGFATELAALPEEGVSVAVMTSMDFANAVSTRIAERALAWIVSRQRGEMPAAVSTTAPAGREVAEARAGVYGDAGLRVRLWEQDGELIAEPPAGFRMRLRPDGDGMIADDRVSRGATFAFVEDALVWRGRQLPPVEDARPAPPPERWGALIGEYGWDHNVLYVLEKDGALCILIEWLAQYPLIEERAGEFRLPDYGLYSGERVRFGWTEEGAISHVVIGGVRFDRRQTLTDGSTFRIVPRLPEDELRARAMAANPPADAGGFRRPDLVDPTALEASIHLDLRYATTNNFMGMVFYRNPVALLQRPAAEALVEVHRGLVEHGYGLWVFDAYRPWFVTKMFYDATPEDMRIFVADPSRGSRHNRGCAVDVTLYDLATGQPAAMVSGYDEFTPRAYPRYPGGTSLQRWHRELLRGAMGAAGFAVYEHEWWHFDHALWRDYPVLNTPFR